MKNVVSIVCSALLVLAVALNQITISSALPVFAAGGFLLLFYPGRMNNSEKAAAAISAGYFLAQLLGNYMTPAPDTSLYYTVRIAGLPVAVFILILYAARRRRTYWMLSGALLVAVAVVDANIIGNALQGIGRTGKIAALELPGMFQWPDWLNAVACPFVAVMALRTENRWMRILWKILSALFLAGALLNGSRMLLLSLFLCALLYMGMTGKLSTRRFMYCVGVLAVVIALLYFIPTTRSRILVMFDPSAMANADRLAVWHSAWRMIVDFPLFGVGNGMFKYLLAKYYTLGHVFRSGELSHAHNLLLSRLADSGIFGTVPFVIMIWYYFKAAYPGRKLQAASRTSQRKEDDEECTMYNVQCTIGNECQGKDRHSINPDFKFQISNFVPAPPERLAGFLAMSGWLFMGLFDCSLRFPPTSLVFSIIAALTIARVNMEDGV